MLKNKLRFLPERPGCYLMKDSQGKVIYVGKAKKLKNRVRSYFMGTLDDKTTRLVKQITDFEIILTSSNLEALVLEMNLIKRYTPKYNIMLKDDKTYPYIKITSERHPQLIITRKVTRDRGKYFGPFPNVQAAFEMKKYLEQLYPLRKCPLSTDHACLYYQLGRCIGSCVREVSEEEYQQAIQHIIRFFHGGYKQVIKDLKRKMLESSNRLDFEKAEIYKKQISYIKATMEKQNILTLNGIDQDVFGVYFQQGWVCIQVFYIRQGKMIDRNVSIFRSFDEPESIFLNYLEQYYATKREIRPEEILLPESVTIDLVQKRIQMQVPIIQPKRGKKKELVNLACRNAQISLQEKLTLKEFELASTNEIFGKQEQ
ncbi:excinuclease ABC subunit UvrC [Cytobacillus sp. Hz8]|uniref:excinuclease ABC subunit UvrC n=1 Tax=Cytobacillus sp. Hz8 TaxID=3347168 RepID=UPI0035DD5CB5